MVMKPKDFMNPPVEAEETDSDKEEDFMCNKESLYDTIRNFNYEEKEKILYALRFLESPLKYYPDNQYSSLEDSIGKHLIEDALLGTYKGKSIKDWEEQRQKALEKIHNAQSLSAACQIALEETEEIQEGIHAINLTKLYKPYLEVEFKMEICQNMILTGASLTDIAKYVPKIELGDAYHVLTDYLGNKLEPTEEEWREIEKYDAMSQDEKTNGITMRDIIGYQCLMSEDGSAFGKKLDIYTAAFKHAKCQLLFPYYDSSYKSPCYEKSFEKLLKRIMQQADKISFDGLENSYSTQEWNLIHRLQEASLDFWNNYGNNTSEKKESES